MKDRDMTQFFVSQLQAKDEQIAALARQIEELTLVLKDRDRASRERDKETQRIIRELTDKITILTQKLYGVKSERSNKKPSVKTVPDPAQESVPEADTEPEMSAGTAQEEKEKRGKPARRTYEGMEEEVHEIDPEGDISGARYISYEDTIRYRFIDAKVIRVIFRRRKYVRGDTILMAELPSMPLERCCADASFLAAILTNKFQYHLPIERQSTMFRNIGMDLSKSTLNDWVRKAIELLFPLIEELQKQVMKGEYLNIDETPVRVLIKGRPTTMKGYIWAFLSEKDKLMFFKYKDGSRGQAVIGEFMEDYIGTIQTDGYIVYKVYEKARYRNRIIRLSCLSHIRRKFIESEPTDDRVTPGLKLINAMYRIEGVYYNKDKVPTCTMTPQEIKAYRKEHLVPLLKALYRWLQKCSRDKTILPRSCFGKAVAYALEEYPGIIRVLRDGSYRVDNNAAERIVRDIVLGRKNYLFCGEHAGAERAAGIYSLIGSCKLCGVNPAEYLEDAIRRIQDHNHLRLDELLPHKWQPLNN